EGCRIARVDQHGPMILSACLKNRVELGIVDFQQRAVLVAIEETERFVEFQALGPCAKAGFEPLGLAMAPIFIVEAIKINLRKGEEPAGMCVIQRVERFL